MPTPKIDEKHQRRLADLGLYAGAIDGLKGRKTNAAIKAFRVRHGLGASVKVDATLIARLQTEWGRWAQPVPAPAADEESVNWPIWGLLALLALAAAWGWLAR